MTYHVILHGVRDTIVGDKERTVVYRKPKKDRQSGRDVSFVQEAVKRGLEPEAEE
jgi:hypothetical protein